MGAHPEHVVPPRMGNGECRHLPRMWGKENPREVRAGSDPLARGKKKRRRKAPFFGLVEIAQYLLIVPSTSSAQALMPPVTL